ncbi:unnamed protein product [Clavelina lepadiformis]|uniref:Uncharacterized protein n=1 Tax=Clavelina lepadiformis TaxID=159417 RepID=A0ABP0H6X5_CLALP
MPLDVRGPHARSLDRISVCSPWPKGLGNPLNPVVLGIGELQLFPLERGIPSEPAEGSLSKRTEAPARVAAASPGKPAASRACRGQDAPVEALDKGTSLSRASSTLAVSSDGREIVRVGAQNQTCSDCFVEAETINDDGSCGGSLGSRVDEGRS